MESPIDFPQDIKPESLKLRAVTVVGINDSVFTGHQETQMHPGQWWELALKLPPLGRRQAQSLIAFMLKLNGAAGTFRLHDHSASQPLGKARGQPVVSTVAVPRQSVLSTSGWKPKISRQLEAGDSIAIHNHLYKVLESVRSDADGNASMRLWPRLREPYPVGTAIVIRKARGVFRMQSNPEWEIDLHRTYSITLTAREAL